MIEAELEICNRLGLHARAAARFVHLANTFQSRITVGKDGARADGKSILGLLTLAASLGTRIQISADGPDERAAVDQIAGLVADRFGESE